jgi:hypothetical protein
MTETDVGWAIGAQDQLLPDGQCRMNHTGIWRRSSAVIGPAAYLKWLEQCRATATIKREVWAEVGIRLFGLGEAVSEVRRIFEVDELRIHLARVEREQKAQELVSHDEEIFDEDEVFGEDPEISAARVRSLMLIKQLLLTPQLGTLGLLHGGRAPRASLCHLCAWLIST